jgi:hypothetical protein
MNRTKLFATTVIAALGLVAVVGSIAIADSRSEERPAGRPEMKLPPGWTEEDMKACTMAATPGRMHERLAREAGVWHARTTMWMAPDTEPMQSECRSVVTSLMDGRFTEVEMTGEMPGMGPYNGLGIYGFDNVSQKFVSSWIDNHGTGIGNGVGEPSPDGKTITWKFTYNCPLTRKPVVMREIETVTGPDTKTLEMYGTDHKSGKEFRLMRIELTRTQGAPRAHAKLEGALREHAEPAKKKAE